MIHKIDLIAAALAIAASTLFTGCQSTADRAKVDATSTEPREMPSPQRIVDLPPPPGLEASMVRPHTGDALEKARRSLDQIIAGIDPPDYLAADEPVEAAEDGRKPDEPTDAEPPLAAQHAFIEARLAWREGQRYRAISELETARRVAPRSEPILRMLGQIYTEIGNKVRGAHYLRQTVALNPNDVRSLFQLSLFAAEQGDVDEAIYTMGRLIALREQGVDADPGIWPLVRFRLAQALERKGYDLAAIEQFAEFLGHSDRFPPTTQFRYQLFTLSRQRGPSFQRLGDARNRMGRPSEALEAYHRAMTEGGVRPLDMLRRLTYTHLRLADRELALSDFEQHLSIHGPSAEALGIVNYLEDHGVDRQRLIALLRTTYEQSGGDAEAAKALAGLLGSDEAAAFLTDHLQRRPGDLDLLRYLVGRRLEESRQQQTLPTEAVRLVIETMRDSPRMAPRAADALLDQTSDIEAVARVLDAIGTEAGPAVQSAAHYLTGLAAGRAGEVDRQIDELRKAIALNPDFESASLALAAALVRAERYEQALPLLDDLPDQGDVRVVRLRVEVLGATGREDEALALIDELIEADPDNIDLILEKARLQLAADLPLAAEVTLRTAIESHEREERLYEALLALYRGDERVRDGQRRAEQLIQQMRREMPNSRIARFEEARELIRRGRMDRAVPILRGLSRERPEDYSALAALMEVLRHLDRTDEADDLLADRLREGVTDDMLFAIAVSHYEQTNNAKQLEALLKRRPESMMRTRMLARFYLRQEKPAEALAILEKAITPEMDDPELTYILLSQAMMQLDRHDEAAARLKKAAEQHPEYAADLLFRRAMVLESAGKAEQSEQAMLAILEDHPDHAPTNNTLGYLWADQGRNLERAKDLIEKALAKEPNVSAYLDSLGWVWYKLGNFQQARLRLQEALRRPGGSHPVIIDHLGDVYWRLGEKDLAERMWRLADQAVKSQDMTGEPEMERLVDRLEAKLKALADNAEPPIASSTADPQPEEVAEQALPEPLDSKPEDQAQAPPPAP